MPRYKVCDDGGGSGGIGGVEVLEVVEVWRLIFSCVSQCVSLYDRGPGEVCCKLSPDTRHHNIAPSHL